MTKAVCMYVSVFYFTVAYLYKTFLPPAVSRPTRPTELQCPWHFKTGLQEI